MSKEASTTPKKPAGKAKKLIMIGIGAFVLIGTGAGVGLYAAGSVNGAEAKEDPKRPKLVARSEEPAEESEGEHGKEPPPKVGTQKNSRSPISRLSKTLPPTWPMARVLCKSV
jgi:flagellar protein FliL